MTYDLIIVGCGPAGLSAAVEAKSRGLNVLVLEKGSIGQTVIEKFPKGKHVYMNYLGVKAEFIGRVRFEDGLSKEDFVKRCRDYISEYRIDVRQNEGVGSIIAHSDQFIVETTKSKYKTKNVVIAIGIHGRPTELPVQIPDDCRSRVKYTLVNPDNYSESDILVAGGGDTAAETAELLIPKNRVTISYRREAFLKGERLSERNYNNLYGAISDGRLIPLFKSNIISMEFIGNKVKVTLDVDGKKMEKVFDYIFPCLGGTTPAAFMQRIGINVSGMFPETDDNFETNVKRAYVIGDAASRRVIVDGKQVMEKKTIVNALRHGVIAVEHMMKIHFRK